MKRRRRRRSGGTCGRRVSMILVRNEQRGSDMRQVAAAHASWRAGRLPEGSWLPGWSSGRRKWRRSASRLGVEVVEAGGGSAPPQMGPGWLGCRRPAWIVVPDERHVGPPLLLSALLIFFFQPEFFNLHLLLIQFWGEKVKFSLLD